MSNLVHPPQGSTGAVSLPFIDQDFNTYVKVTDALVEPFIRPLNTTVSYLTFDELNLTVYWKSFGNIEMCKWNGSGWAALVNSIALAAGLPFPQTVTKMQQQTSMYGHTSLGCTDQLIIPIIKGGKATQTISLSNFDGTAGSFDVVISGTGRYIVALGRDKANTKKTRLIVYQGF